MFNFSLPVGQFGTEYQFATESGATLPSGGTLVAGSQADDAVVSVVVPADFNFRVYNTDVAGGTTIRASTNGTLQFLATGGATAFANTALPATVFAANTTVLMPFLDDLDMLATDVAGGGIYTHLTGTAPNRQFIIEWRARPYLLGTPAAPEPVNTNFAIVLNEGGNAFQYRYVSSAAGANLDGLSATVGVQRATTGTAFTQFSFNQANVPAGRVLRATLPTGTCSPGPGICSSSPDPIYSHGFETPPAP